MFRFVTAGESHGQALIAWVSGVSAGVPIDFVFMQGDLLPHLDPCRLPGRTGEMELGTQGHRSVRT